MKKRPWLKSTGWMTGGNPARTAVRRKLIKAILARTKAARAELDKKIAGADLSGLEAYPFVVRGTPGRRRGIKTAGVVRRAEDHAPAL